MDLTNMIENTYAEVVEIYRHLHRHPELSEQEIETANYICRTLDAHNIPYQRDIAGHGIAALIEGNGSGCIGIRADIDALAITETTGVPLCFCESWRDARLRSRHAYSHSAGNGMVLNEIKIN